MTTQHADPRNALPETDDADTYVRDVAYLALQGADLAVRAVPPGRDGAKDAASALEQETLNQVRNIFHEEDAEAIRTAALDAVGERLAGAAVGASGGGGRARRVAPGRLRRVRSELRDAREYLGEDADVPRARQYVEKGLQRLREAMASALPGSHDHIEPGQFGDDGLFRGHARCVACGTVEELDGVEPKRRGPDKGLVRERIRGMAGTYLEATCPGCFTSLLAMDDGELAPVMGRRGW